MSNDYDEFVKRMGSFDMDFNDETLEHHGVKGMKWGVRKDRSSTGRIRKTLDSVKESRELSKTSRKRERSWSKVYKQRGEMSDDELGLVLNRLKMENKFAQQVTEASSSQRKKAKRYMQQLGNLRVGSGGQTLKAAVTQQVVKTATAAASAL